MTPRYCWGKLEPVPAPAGGLKLRFYLANDHPGTAREAIASAEPRGKGN
jgi:hypothetical protein